MEQEKKKRGFAAMNPEKAREIQRKGGVAAHAAGTAHQYTSEEAKAAAMIAVAKRQGQKETA